ncbi:hypothetical protein [Polyangium sp. 15x6]|uniref:plasmid mobilization protein n=1 Tax=Polyangium sp. 15x6 TaxID=3042687 RepID=UPI00249B0E5F|nr:hypothetical protein [Polyangium sp. 15x6]MDI3290138.1 hypothetical protein [Polyangium sp. 15x6]
MSFRLTRAEAEALQSAAEEAGIARNEYARRTMLGHLSSRGYAPPAPPRALRRVSPVDAGPREPREPIPLRASSAPALAEAPAGRNVVSLDARPPPRSPRRPSSAAARRSIGTSAPLAAALADPPLDVAPVLAEARPLRPSVETNGAAPPAAPVDAGPADRPPSAPAEAEAPRREPREPIGEHERGLEDARRPASSRAAAAPAEAEEALDARPALPTLAASATREAHEAGLDVPAEADPDHALDAPPASVHELAEVPANEARLDDAPELSEAGAAVLAAARSLAALDPSAPIPAPVLVLEVHVGGMSLEEARAAVLVLVTRGELAAEAGDDASGLAPVDASGRTITAVRLATALEG